MRPACETCGQEFEITQAHLDFYDKLSPSFGDVKCALPPATKCPPCRQQLRNSWRNERALYKRNCDLCKQSMISLWPQESPYVIYCNRCFWSDGWEPHPGFDYDFTKTFAEQFDRVWKSSPFPGTVHVNAVNSDYCNRVYDSRNNYLSVIVLFGSENILHGYWSINCKDLCDICICQYCELSYELVDGERCHRCFYSTRLRNCNECWFCEDCIGCSSCFQCKNLRQKRYCIRNEQVTKEEYEAFMKNVRTGSTLSIEALKRESAEFFLRFPHRASLVIDCENCTGANIFHCKDSEYLFNFYESERMLFCGFGEKNHDCMDCFGLGAGEFCYECQGFVRCNQNLFCLDCSDCSNIAYCSQTFANSTDCFGCVGLKKRKYCILNKQYTKEEYEVLMPKIIEHMRSTGEWGRWYPAKNSPHGYNETVALEQFPLTREEALAAGFRWKEKDPKEYRPSSTIVPDDIAHATDALLNEVLACKDCGKNYKIIAQELDFYRRHALPVPRCCPDCRHLARIKLRPPARLWKRNCKQCEKEVLSSYAPDRPEIVYCENCYLAEVY